MDLISWYWLKFRQWKEVEIRKERTGEFQNFKILIELLIILAWLNSQYDKATCKLKLIRKLRNKPIPPKLRRNLWLEILEISFHVFVWFLCARTIFYPPSLYFYQMVFLRVITSRQSSVKHICDNLNKIHGKYWNLISGLWWILNCDSITVYFATWYTFHSLITMRIMFNTFF